jgi:NADPH2:quinone reductase
MHAWMCDNPIGPDALLARSAHPRSQLPARCGGHPCCQPELPRHPDRARASTSSSPPRPSCPARIRGPWSSAVGSRRHQREGRVTRWRPSAAPAASAPTPCVPAEKLVPLPRGLSSRRRRVCLHLRHLAPRADRPRPAEGRRDRAGAGRAGGVGTAAVQIAKAAGAQGDRRRLHRRKVRLQGDRRRRDDQLQHAATCATALKALTGGKGPDVVYDPVGGDLAEPVFRSIAWRGRYLVVGFAGGGIPALPLNLALLKGAAVVGVFWGDFVRASPANFRAWATGAVVRAGQDQAGHRPRPANERTKDRLPAWARAPGGRQAGAGQP